MPLNDDEKKQLEELQRKDKEPAGSAHSLVIHVGNEGGMTIAEAVRRGYLTELEAEELEDEDDDNKDKPKGGRTRKRKPAGDDDKDDEEPPRRGGYFRES